MRANGIMRQHASPSSCDSAPIDDQDDEVDAIGSYPGPISRGIEDLPVPCRQSERVGIRYEVYL